MRRAKPCTTLLLALVFFAGIVAPVPECYVTKLACTLKRGACSGLERKAAPALSDRSSCCAKASHAFAGLGLRPNLKPWMKPFAPDIETVEAPPFLAVFSQDLFPRPLIRDNAFFARIVEDQDARPDPIPILLHKQSLLL